MTMVLVHGGGLGKECWNLLLPFLDGDVIAVDLPGRGDRPGDLSKIGIADFVDAVVDDILSRDLRDVVLVGHSLAGLTIPQVAARVPERIRALVFVSCTVPRDGQNTYDTLDPEIQAISDSNPRDELTTLDPQLATAVFYNDVTDPDVLAWALSLLVPEAPASVTDPMVLSTMPRDIRRVWIRLNSRPHRRPGEAGPVCREPRRLRGARARRRAHGDDQPAAGGRSAALGDLTVPRSVPPTDAEGVTGGVGVDLVALGGGEIVGSLQQTSAERDDLIVGARRVVDVEIEMDLLRCAVGPVGRGVVGCELHADPPLTVGVDDAVPALVGVGDDAPAEHSGPKRALGRQVRRVEHDDLPRDLHLTLLLGTSHRLPCATLAPPRPRVS